MLVFGGIFGGSNSMLSLAVEGPRGQILAVLYHRNPSFPVPLDRGKCCSPLHINGLGFSDGLSSPCQSPPGVLNFLIENLKIPTKHRFLGCYSSGGMVRSKWWDQGFPPLWSQDAGVIRVNPAQVRSRCFPLGGEDFLGGWFQTCFIFTPKIGEDSNFD